MRKSSAFFLSAAIMALLVCVMVVHAIFRERQAVGALERKRMMVETLSITDLCLFTDARYTRHLSQTDLHAPFQDHPGALEHFPSGSLVSGPFVFRGSYEKLD